MNEMGISMNTGTGRVFLVPKAIHPLLLKKLRLAFRAIFDDPEFKTEMRKIGKEPLWLDGEIVEKQMVEFSKNAGQMIEKYKLK